MAVFISLPVMPSEYLHIKLSSYKYLILSNKAFLKMLLENDDFPSF